MTKLCKDCHYHKSHDYYGYGTGIYDECLHPKLKKSPSLVTGKTIMTFCDWARAESGKCGPNAKYFEPKRPPETKEQFWSRFFNFGSK